MFSIIEFLLAERKLSIYNLAKATGIPSGAIFDWKSGRSKPSVSALTKLADFFGVSVDYLLGRITTITQKRRTETVRK